jgi:DNA-binding beta-propeller fold protein YncE
MKSTASLVSVVASFLVTAAALVVLHAQAPAIPTYQVDPFWPKEMPNEWMFGNVVGLAVDSHDNVWVTHRPISPGQPGSEKTPPVLEFDQAGNLIRSWGGRATIPEWGTKEHGLYIDHKDNVWVGFGGGLPYDVTSKGTTDNANFLKLTPAGKLLLQIGVFGMGTLGSLDPKSLGNPTDVFVDPKTNEAYISDGYINRRVISYDADTGAFKKLWGAYGNKPDDSKPQNMQMRRSPQGPQPQQFNTPHCVVGTNDGLLYVCDRNNERVQIFRHDGSFVKEGSIVDKDALIQPQDIAISLDAQQRYLFVLTSEKVYIVLREPFQIVGSFGHKGHSAGQMTNGHSLAIDSKGNLYVGETLQGSRLQKFAPKTTSAKR